MATNYGTYSYPGNVSSSPAIGTNGSTAPTQSEQVAGQNPSGNLQPLQTDASGNLLVNINSETGAPFHVIVDSSALPTGASTSALQTTGNTSLASILSDLTNGTQVTQITGTVPLPTGAATAANQTNVQSTAGTSASTLITVQGSASGVAIPVSIAGTVSTTDSANGPVNPGAVASKSELSGGQYNTTLPTLTNTQQAALQVDSSGRMLVSQPTASALNVTVGASSNIIGNVRIDQTTPGTTNGVQINAGAATIGSVKLTDGTNTETIKAASTAPVATDTALVVSVSPNSADPALGSLAGGTAGTKSYAVGGVYNSSAPTLTNTQQASLQLDVSGNLKTTASFANSATSTITSVASATTSTSLLSSNTSRKGAYFFNDSTSVLYLAFASSASTTAYTVQIASNGFYEMPNPAVYTGAIYGIWSAANGNVRITELS